jgi:hypothetical protein
MQGARDMYGRRHRLQILQAVCKKEESIAKQLCA